MTSFQLTRLNPAIDKRGQASWSIIFSNPSFRSSIALDVLGVLPLYAGFSMDLDEKRKRRVLRESIITAFFVALGFVLIGNQILIYLNIAIEDFLIAGGVILFIIAARDLIGLSREDLAGQDDLFAVVPLGAPRAFSPRPSSSSIRSALPMCSSPWCSICSSPAQPSNIPLSFFVS